MVFIYGTDMFECSKAAKSDTEVVLYDSLDNEIHHLSNIIGEEWNYIQLVNGEWSELEPQPTPEEVLNARIERLQADMDYCLMLLDE